MRDDATFIGIEVADELVGDAELAAALEQACPVDIYANDGGRVAVVHENVDECILCGLCLLRGDRIRVHKLYSGEVLAASPSVSPTG
jgi:ferredoxin-like protein FixX